MPYTPIRRSVISGKESPHRNHGGQVHYYVTLYDLGGGQYMVASGRGTVAFPTSFTKDPYRGNNMLEALNAYQGEVSRRLKEGGKVAREGVDGANKAHED